MITMTEPGKCESEGYFSCVLGTATVQPVITQPALYAGASTVSGTAVANATVRLYTNGALQGTTTATGGNYSFSNLALVTGDVVTVNAQSSGLCVSAGATLTVQCSITAPIINTDNNGSLSTTQTTISGTSSEAAGTVVTIWESGVNIGTATVQSNGTWSRSYVPVSSKSYTATQQVGTCVSAASAAVNALTATTVCPAFGASSYMASASAITGTISPTINNGNIKLYLDGNLIGSVSANASPWSITVNSGYSNTLYPGGVLTVTAQQNGRSESSGCASAAITCAIPTTPSITPASSNITIGQTVNFNVSNSQSGILYSVTNATSSTTNYAVSKFGTGSSLSLPTSSFNTSGAYNVNVNAISLSGAGCYSSSAASISVTGLLPVELSYFNGRYIDGQSQLDWETQTEDNVDHFAIERSDDARQFTEIGRVAAKGNSVTTEKYSYRDPKVVNNAAWYRLRTVDKDQESKYSKVIRINNATGNVNVQSVMPNPFESQLQMQVYTNKAMLTQIRIVDMTGREVYKTNNMLSAGNNNVRLSSLGVLSKGVYMLQLLHQNEVIFKQQIQKIH